MIPAPISEDASSLVPNRIRPALSFLSRVDGEGKVVDLEIVQSLIRSRRRLSYGEVDALLGEGESAPAMESGASEGSRMPGDDGRLRDDLESLHRIASTLESGRVSAGAVLFRAPEVSVKVSPDGRVLVRRLDERGSGRRLVAEFMILANRLTARFCEERGIAAIYRRQPPPDKTPDSLPEGPYDPVAVRALRKVMRRGGVSPTPDVHFALGVTAYLQITSPLRRYQDLVMQRQLRSWLSGGLPVYESAEMARIAATTESAERAARQAEAATTSYWILKYLGERAGELLEGVIVTVEPRRTVVEICETLSVTPIAHRPDHREGARIWLRIEGSRPREGLLFLTEVEQENRPSIQ
jgi:exoribonuclease-2